MENKQEEILALLNGYYEDYSDIGKLWGESLADSFNAELETAMKSLKLLRDGVNEFSTTLAMQLSHLHLLHQANLPLHQQVVLLLKL